MYAEKQIALATAIKEHLDSLKIEDETLIHDTFEGQTDIYECMDWLLGKIAHEDAFAEAVEVQINKLEIRKSSAGNRKAKWRELLQQAVEATGEKTVKRPAATITLAPKPLGLEIIDESIIPQEFFIIETVKKLDKKKLKEAVADGFNVPGAALDNGGVSLRIRT
jgi:hypothetical protein